MFSYNILHNLETIAVARKVFISYKYADSTVLKIGELAICRDYVNVLMRVLEDIHIYKGEEDDNDLSRFKDETIRTSLKEKIRDSSVTVVLISPGMKEYKSEEDQWIPWEISYSLRETTFDNRTSLANGIVAVVLPDTYGSYSYYFQYSNCQHCKVMTHKTDDLFTILKNNMFNKKNPFTQTCLSPLHGSTYHVGNDHSYIQQVTWKDFLNNPTFYIEHSIALRDRINEFDIQKTIV